MTAKTLSLNYVGYWREENIGGIPAKSGVYSVYACRYDTSEKAVSIRELIYIGESKNVRDRIENHEKWPKWKRHINNGEQICINFAPIVYDRDRAEATMINSHKPPENIEYIDSHPYDQTTINTSGRSAQLKTSFTV